MYTQREACREPRALLPFSHSVCETLSHTCRAVGLSAIGRCEYVSRTCLCVGAQMRYGEANGRNAIVCVARVLSVRRRFYRARHVHNHTHTKRDRRERNGHAKVYIRCSMVCAIAGTRVCVQASAVLLCLCICRELSFDLAQHNTQLSTKLGLRGLSECFWEPVYHLPLVINVLS